MSSREYVDKLNLDLEHHTSFLLHKQRLERDGLDISDHVEAFEVSRKVRLSSEPSVWNSWSVYVNSNSSDIPESRHTSKFPVIDDFEKDSVCIDTLHIDQDNIDTTPHSSKRRKTTNHEKRALASDFIPDSNYGISRVEKFRQNANIITLSQTYDLSTEMNKFRRLCESVKNDSIYSQVRDNVVSNPRSNIVYISIVENYPSEKWLNSDYEVWRALEFKRYSEYMSDLQTYIKESSELPKLIIGTPGDMNLSGRSILTGIVGIEHYTSNGQKSNTFHVYLENYKNPDSNNSRKRLFVRLLFPEGIEHNSAVFPGAALGVVGNYSSVNRTEFTVEKIIDYQKPIDTSTSEAPIEHSDDTSLGKMNRSLLILAVSGPFSFDGEGSVHSLDFLTEYIRGLKTKPHILIIMGPFLDSRDSVFRKGVCKKGDSFTTFEEFYDGEIIPRIYQMEKECRELGTKIFILQSMYDVLSKYQGLPQSHPCIFDGPVDKRQNLNNLRSRGTMIPVTNPCTLDMNGFVIYVTGEDPIASFSSKILRIGSTASKIIHSMRFIDKYSILFPASPPIVPTIPHHVKQRSISIDLGSLDNPAVSYSADQRDKNRIVSGPENTGADNMLTDNIKRTLVVPPHPALVIYSSILQPGVVTPGTGVSFLNPGRFCKGRGIGTFANINIRGCIRDGIWHPSGKFSVDIMKC